MDGVSVIIPCLNEEAYIASCLDGLINNGYSKEQLELIVIDGGSLDGTLEILKLYSSKYSFVRAIDNPYKKTPFALNLGIKNAKFNKVLIAGAHAIYPEGYISRLSKLLQRTEIDVVGGAIETRVKNINAKSEAICYVLSHPLGVGNSIFRTGAKELLEVDTVPFGLYRKEIFDKVGLYDEKLIRNHDMELSSRIKEVGYKIWLEPNMKCTYFARETFKGLAENNYGNGLWNLKTLRITGKFSSLGLRHYIPMLFVLSLVIPIVISPFFNFEIWLLACLSFFLYILSVFTIAIKTKGLSLRHVVFTFIVLHLSYGFGSMVGILALFKRK